MLPSSPTARPQSVNSPKPPQTSSSSSSFCSSEIIELSEVKPTPARSPALLYRHHNELAILYQSRCPTHALRTPYYLLEDLSPVSLPFLCYFALPFVQFPLAHKYALMLSLKNKNKVLDTTFPDGRHPFSLLSFAARLVISVASLFLLPISSICHKQSPSLP